MKNNGGGIEKLNGVGVWGLIFFLGVGDGMKVLVGALILESQFKRKKTFWVINGSTVILTKKPSE